MIAFSITYVNFISHPHHDVLHVGVFTTKYYRANAEIEIILTKFNFQQFVTQKSLNSHQNDIFK